MFFIIIFIKITIFHVKNQSNLLLFLSKIIGIIVHIVSFLYIKTLYLGKLIFMQISEYKTFLQILKEIVYKLVSLWYHITNDRCFSTSCLPQSHNIRQLKHLSFFKNFKLSGNFLTTFSFLHNSTLFYIYIYNLSL